MVYLDELLETVNYHIQKLIYSMHATGQTWTQAKTNFVQTFEQIWSKIYQNAILEN